MSGHCPEVLIDDFEQLFIHQYILADCWFLEVLEWYILANEICFKEESAETSICVFSSYLNDTVDNEWYFILLKFMLELILLQSIDLI